MPRHIPPGASADTVIVPTDDPLANDCYFRLVQMPPQSQLVIIVPGFEVICVVLSGTVEIKVDGKVYPAVGKRPDIWSGSADSVYLGTNHRSEVVTEESNAEVAIIGGRCAAEWAPFRVTPAEVEPVKVGSLETHSLRQINHILGQNAKGRSGNLLVSELFASPGCWSGYPPHKHDQERPPVETAFQEIYHYRFDPPSGFGAQYHYREGHSPACTMTRHGDTFIVEDGYHPTATSPGHRGYILTILVGRHQRSLIQYFDPIHDHLMDKIPGINDMRAKFA